jgi:hypothetical protein
MDTVQTQTNTEVENRVFETLVQLVASNPESSQSISEVINYIRALETEIKLLPSQGTNRPGQSKNQNQFYVAPTRRLAPHAYQWSETALREHPHGETRSHLQVSVEDYLAVAKAIEDCNQQNPLMTASAIGETTKKYTDRKIPPTQMYLCIRFWRSKELVARASGRKLNLTNLETPFSEVAEKLIDS